MQNKYMIINLTLKLYGGIIMREAKYTKPLTIALPDEVYDFVKQKTDALRISLSEWFREAALSKIRMDQSQNKEEIDNE
jgi:hypothetical protein